MKRKVGIAMLLCIIFISIFWTYTRKPETYLSFPDFLDYEIRELVIKSLDFEYKNIEDDYLEIFTEEFFMIIQDEKMSQMKFAPYRLFDNENQRITYNDNGDVSSLTLHVEDQQSSFFQIIYLEKIEGHYYISNILLDM